MRTWRSRLSRAQRVVVSVAIGLVLVGGHEALTDELRGRGGWFGYAPNTSITFAPGNAFSRNPGLQFLLWMLFVVIWLATSLWLLADQPSSDS